MALTNLQSLVLRTALDAANVATGRDGNGFAQSVCRTPAGFQSLPWHPLPGPYATGTQSMEPSIERAGRSARAAGVPVRTSLARIASGSILSGWAASSVTAVHKHPRVGRCAATGLASFKAGDPDTVAAPRTRMPGRFETLVRG